MSSVHFGCKPNRKRVCGSLNRTSQNHYVSEPNRTKPNRDQSESRLTLLTLDLAREQSTKRPRNSGILDILVTPHHRFKAYQWLCWQRNLISLPMRSDYFVSTVGIILFVCDLLFDVTNCGWQTDPQSSNYALHNGICQRFLWHQLKRFNDSW